MHGFDPDAKGEMMESFDAELAKGPSPRLDFRA
jgi:hypothetical protein